MERLICKFNLFVLLLLSGDAVEKQKALLKCGKQESQTVLQIQANKRII